MTEQFNGWINRETWAVHKWLSDDTTFYPAADGKSGLMNAREEVAHAWGQVDELASFSDGAEYWANRADYAGMAGDRMQEFVTELFAVDRPSPHVRAMQADIGDLRRVDWREVAQAFMEE